MNEVMNGIEINWKKFKLKSNKNKIRKSYWLRYLTPSYEKSFIFYDIFLITFLGNISTISKIFEWQLTLEAKCLAPVYVIVY